jgi:hypothetical protein
MRQEDKIRLMDESLVRALPESHGWARGRWTAGTDGFGYWIEVESRARPIVRRLRIVLRHDGDIQVEFHIDGKPGSPFECLFVLQAGDEEQAIEDVSRFVGHLIAERLVLGYARGMFRGGRRFLAPERAESDRRHLKWTTSWLGTHDWQP